MSLPLLLSFGIVLVAYSRLDQVIVVTRHGARSPVFDPIDETFQWNCSLPARISKTPLSTQISVDRLFYQSNSPFEMFDGNCFSGQLLTLGMQEHYSLGKSLRSQYVGTLISEGYSSSEVYLESTDKDRTIQSMQSLTLGLFPETATPSRELVTYVCQEQCRHDMYANWYASPMACPKMLQIFDAIVKSPEFVAFQDSCVPFRKNLSKILNWSLAEVDLFQLHDSLHCLEAFHTLPQGLTQTLVDEIEDLVDYEYFHFYWQSTDFVKLGIGHFVGRMLDALAGKSELGKYKFLLFSGHDTTIMPLTTVFAFGTKTWPPFAANIVLELHSDSENESKAVRVLYDGQEMLLSGLGCEGVYCDYDVFVAAVSKWVPENWAKECEVTGNILSHFVSPSSFPPL